ncbi:Cln3p [Saccharomyces cerevisiae x Saccharomyces kudriavzevii VIN7]|uniref:Cln3p n=1 Tax=Saccharomyces cerevisiae x Saccharomyces kudriavzevii (strain VIN7) TaxID=1095631 RepID=H0GQS7_SACCK|nr:Cln3p [Saccharomyces cerevisiae x Saccharomyces kudriavzevii VIN7]
MAILKDTIIRYANASYATSTAGSTGGAAAVRTTSYPNLPLLLQKRRAIASTKSKNPNLVKRELQAHHSAISVYNNDHLNHYFQLSHAEKPLYNLSNFTSQPQVNPKMRFLIFDFIMYCHTRLNLSTSTLFLTFTILDKYSSRFIIKSYNYQLLSLTALWISSKFWDSKNRMATLKVLQNLCCNQYSIKQFTTMEMHLFKSLDWSICQSATLDSYIDIFLFQSTSPLPPVPTLSAPLEGFIQQKLALLNDAAGTAINKPSSPQGPSFNINEIKLGAIMLCELASFNLELSFKYDRSLIALGAINLIKLSLNYYNSNVWENFNVAFEENDQDLDIKLSDISNTLLDVAMEQDFFPSSFKSKYLNNNKTSPAKSLLDALQNYCIQLKLEEFYRSQELETTYNGIFSAQYYDDDSLACVCSNATTPKSATVSSATTDYFSDHTHLRRLTKENISTPFAFTPTSSSSSPSPFTSPYKTSSSMTTPDSASHHSHSGSSSTQNSFKRSLSIPQNSSIFWPSPLTPTTPSFMSNRKLLQNLSARSKRLLPIRSMASAHSFAVPTHLKKRSTSSMDCDFNDSSNLKKTR